MDKKDWVLFEIRDNYPHLRKLRELLDEIYVGSFELSMTSGMVVIRAPRRPTKDELYALSSTGRYRYLYEENKSIGTFTDGSTTGKGGHTAGSGKRPLKSVLFSSQPLSGTAAEDRNAPDISQIPLFDSETQIVPPIESKLHAALSPTHVIIQNTASNDGQNLRGLYAIPIESGETSNVFGVETRLSLNGPLANSKDVVRKCAVKRLHESTSAEQFWTEYESLKRLTTLEHPHLIETLSVFRSETNGIQYFNFVFPLALSNLKRLFRDFFVPLPLRSRNIQSLWGQFPGLSSAVAHLHDSAHMAHRDIKPSNILIYEDPSGKDLILKLTDFGLSVDLSRARTWEQGSRARQSAWLYDSPEVRKASPMTEMAQSNEKISIPSASDLMSNDIWKLGCVFTEMLAYLVCGGSTGVNEFRDHITTTEDKISSDVFNDTRFDDGEQIKPQVLEFLERMACKDTRARMLQATISEMLSKSALRPTIKRVCENLAQNNFPNIGYNDGVRVVRFVPADRLPYSRFDKWKLNIERWTGRPIDWAPFGRPQPKLDAGGFLATWNWNGVELFLGLSQDQHDRYRATCFPVTTNNVPLLPLAHQGQKSQKTASPLGNTNQSGNIVQPSQSSLGTNATVANVSPGRQPSIDTKDIYWCIERNFTEPTEIYLSPIQNAENLLDDEALFCQVNTSIGSTAGWIRRLFSWKRCTAIDFVQFLVIWENKDQVNPIQKELPPPTTPFYNHSVPSPHDFHMRAIGLQMVFGLRDPKKGRGERSIIGMLPKKKNPPPFSRRISEPGWGLHAKMGFSQRRFIVWLLLCVVLCAAFVVLWLVFISKTDLQNAFVPSALGAALLVIPLGLLQVA
ncbi:hypothetical protein FPOA_03381 [Fusarium poae]|uniref:Protein kinase domain-containing protein n=1 Tax=Fusarium poae TaxID=36050 RepID=A0A1B8B9P4_FUSPO|nr:hypothetical protein FPOA_03381 [Fusarium poae]